MHRGLIDLTVPSIAQEYVRNRTKHDREARRWTELYARPPQDKGKGKAVVTSSSLYGALGDGSSMPQQRSRPSNADPETIVLDDADQVRVPNSMASSRLASKRKRTGGNNVDIDSSAEHDDDFPIAAAKRRKTPVETASSPADEVIIIED